jgi:uncharacterized protein (DUF1778 family)
VDTVINKMARKRGAPKKQSRKEESLRIRVTREQKATFQLAAEGEGLTMSSWIVATALERARGAAK